MLTPIRKQIAAGMMGFYEYLPTGYDSVKKYPLIVFMHGMGQIGNGDSDLVSILSLGLPMYVKNGMELDAVVLMPQSMSWSSGEQAKEVIDYGVKNYCIDTSRIYVTGLSMGGAAVWEFGGNYPHIPACLIVVCPASSTTKLQGIVDNKVKIIGYHAKDDSICSFMHTQGPVQALNDMNINPPAEMTIFPTGGHNIWNHVYEPSFGLYEEMFKYKKGVINNMIILPEQTKYLTQTRGFTTNTTALYGSTKIIANTTEQELYQSERWGDFYYDLPITNGDYSVKMKFCELYFNNPGQRKFNVDINGQRVLTSYDMVAEAGKFTAIEKSFPVKITNGKLKIEFMNDAKITSIEITPGSTTPPPPNQIKTEAEFTFPGGKYTLLSDGKWIKA